MRERMLQLHFGSGEAADVRDPSCAINAAAGLPALITGLSNSFSLAGRCTNSTSHVAQTMWQPLRSYVSPGVPVVISRDHQTLSVSVPEDTNGTVGDYSRTSFAISKGSVFGDSKRIHFVRRFLDTFHFIHFVGWLLVVFFITYEPKRNLSRTL